MQRELNRRTILQSTTFLAIVACFLWSTAFAGVKIGLRYLTPLQFAAIRFFIAGFLVFPLAGNLRSYFRQVGAHWNYVLLIAFLQVVLMYSLFYTGMNRVPASLGAMVIGSGPLFIALVAHFSIPNDRMNMKTTFALLLGVVGIVFINLGRQISNKAGAGEILGVFILIGNNLVGGLYNVIVKKSQRTIAPLVLSSSSLILGGALLFLISLPIEGWQIRTFPTEFYLSLGWLSFLSAAAISIWFTLLQRPEVKLSKVNTWKFLIPVLGAVLSWILIRGESPDFFAVSGMLIVGASLLVMNHEAFFEKRNRKKRKEGH
ncbi:MAG TPA: DMT family transporter [Prolixibacteraceae bacterium]|nr:DMT family transporter [Prolixibacteraceae bacterium]